MKRWTLRGGAAVLALGLAFATSATALANDDDVIKRGNCSGRTDWKLKVKPDDGRLEVEGEIDSNRNRQVWRWKIMHDGSLSTHGRAITRGPSGSFEIERRIVDTRGVDHIVFRAVNLRNGEICRGVVRI